MRDPDVVYLTVFNDSNEAKDARVTLNKYFADIVGKKDATVRELTRDVELKLDGGAFDVDALDAQDVRVYEFKMQN